MALPIVTTPLQSQNKSPFQAVIPSALRGPSIPANVLVASASGVGRYYGVASAAAQLTSSNYIAENVGDTIYGNSTTVVPIGFPTKLQAAQQGFPLFSTVLDTASGLGSGTTVFNQDGTVSAPNPPFNLYNISNIDLDVVINIFSTAGESWAMSGPVDASAAFPKALAQMRAVSLTGALGPGLTGLIGNSWGLDPSIPTGGAGSGKVVSVNKELIKYIGSRPCYFFIARFQGGFSHTQWSPDIASDIFNKVTFVSDGFITNGQTIGDVSDNPNIILPFPATDPLSFTALGTNCLLNDGYFAVLGQSFSAFLKNNPLNDPP